MRAAGPAFVWVVLVMVMGPPAGRAWPDAAIQENGQPDRRHDPDAGKGGGPSNGIAPLVRTSPFDPNPRLTLGERLTLDQELSRIGTVSCTACHDVSPGFTDSRPAAWGVGGIPARRTASTILNPDLRQNPFWMGRASRPAASAGPPILDSLTLGPPSKSCLTAMGKECEELRLFEDAGGPEPTYQDLERTLTALERTLLFLNAQYDDFLRGNLEAIPPETQDGWRLTNDKGRCAACHRLDASTPFGADPLGAGFARKKNVGSPGRRAQGEGTRDAAKTLSLDSELAELGRLLAVHNRVDLESQEHRRIRRIGLSTPHGQGDSLHPLWEILDHPQKDGEEGTFPKMAPGPDGKWNPNSTPRP